MINTQALILLIIGNYNVLPTQLHIDQVIVFMHKLIGVCDVIIIHVKAPYQRLVRQSLVEALDGREYLSFSVLLVSNRRIEDKLHNAVVGEQEGVFPDSGAHVFHLVIIAVGILPNTEPAEDAGLETEDGRSA